MISITRTAFFATVGQLDVTPYPQGRYDIDKSDYRSLWKQRDGRIVGESFGDEYLVEESLLSKVVR